eukprot:366130-Chlamydomonas_euryale.AAC.22
MGDKDRIISLEEVKQHTKDEDCWLVVHGNVYDVTDFLEEHPGGYDVILSVTGGSTNQMCRVDFEAAFHRFLTAWDGLQPQLGTFMGYLPCMR